MALNAGGASTDDDHTTRQNAGNTAEENSAPIIVLRQKIGAHDYRHASGDFAHWFQQRQFVTDLDGFVSDARYARFEQGLQ